MTEPVAAAEIARRLGVERQTVDQWRHRGIFPEPSWPPRQTGRPLWRWDVVEQWARATGRLPPAPTKGQP